MSNAIEPGYVIPTPQRVKTMGLLNIVFGALLLLMSLFGAMSFLMMPYYVRMMQTQQQTLERQIKAEADAKARKEIEEIDKELETAKTDEEKASIVAKKERVKNRPKPYTPDMTLGMKMVNNPAYRRYQWADYLTSVPLNLALLIAGIGLMRLKRWGRSLSNWLAGLKIARALFFLFFSVMFIAPDMTKSLGRSFDQMGQQIAAQQGTNPANAAKVQEMMRYMTRVVGAMITGAYVLTYVIAMIYPIVLLVILNKPGARAALVAKPVTRGDTLT